MEAAMAMGGGALLMDDSSVMDKLIKFYHDRCYDPHTHRPKQHYFDNLAEQLVNQVGPHAVIDCKLLVLSGITSVRQAKGVVDVAPSFTRVSVSHA